jgi:probable rRNA maturation factor
MITIAPEILSPQTPSPTPAVPDPACGHDPTLQISKPALTRFLNRARRAVNLPGNVSVLLTTDLELQRLNRTFRNQNKPTDVLSFPAAPIPGLPPAHQHAGDLAISLDTAGRQAKSFNHSLETELRILLLHGLLHLAGLDHETDHGQMATRESQLRTELGLPNTLIARTLDNRSITKTSSSRPKSSHSEDAVERPPHSARTSKHASRKPKTSAPTLRTDNKQQSMPRKRGKP